MSKAWRYSTNILIAGLIAYGAFEFYTAWFHLEGLDRDVMANSAGINLIWAMMIVLSKTGERVADAQRKLADQLHELSRLYGGHAMDIHRLKRQSLDMTAGPNMFANLSSNDKRSDEPR